MLLNRPVSSTIIVLATLIFGGITLSRLSIELLPDVTEPTLLINTIYTGAPAMEVEYRINEPLERVLGSVRGIKKINGIARQGQSLVFLTFNWGTDIDIAFLNVREKLNQAEYFLPSQTDRPQLIYSSSSDEPIAILSLTSPESNSNSFESRLALKRWAEQVFSRRLEQIDGIAQAILVGELEPEVQIRYNPKLLARYELSLSFVEKVVRDANIFSASGELRDGWYRYALKIQSRIESLEDIKNIPVKSLGNGRVLVLEELADVKMLEADPTSFALLDNQEVINVLIKKEYGSNTVSAFEALKNELKLIQEQNSNISINIIKERASYIENSVSNLLQTLIIGGILAFIVLFLFLDDIRTPFTIGISIPVSIFLTFILMYLLDIQLNIVSLSGLTLGIGLLLDNSIVVLENINRYREKGFNRFKASSKGVKEIALAVSASTFTTISVFLPLIFLGGFEGAFFRDLAATLSISLISSLLVALIILPVFVAQYSSKSSFKILLKLSEILNNITLRYESGLAKIIKRPILVSITTVLLVGVSFGLFMIIPKSALPESQPSRVDYLVTLPGNTSLKSAKESSAMISRLLKDKTGITNILSMGGYTDNINPISIKNEGLNKFIISVPVSEKSEVKKVNELFLELENTYQSWSFNDLSVGEFNTSTSFSESPVQFGIVSTDRNNSKRVGAALQDYLKKDLPEIELTEKYPQTVQVYYLKFKADNLLLYKISEQEILNYIESLTRGRWITDWNRQDEQVSLRLISDETVSNDPMEIKLEINDKIVPLSELATIEISQDPEQIERSGQSAILTYNSSLSFKDWWWNSSKIEKGITDFIQQTGHEIRISGSALSLIDLLKELGLLLLMSVLLIYLILAIQYENLVYPLIIILAIPFAWVGSIFALYLFGISLNALSFMGVLVLTGIAVNDSILKVDFMRRYYQETKNLDEAIKQAGINRFRPVVMTSITTILGLLPMLIPFGDGYIFRQSLAIALIGGMITSTILTLYLIPFVFRLITIINEKQKVITSQ